MELDQLSYRFQVNPPFGSQCESSPRLPITIIFPDKFEYFSEGKQWTLRCHQPRRDARLTVSSTRFHDSGIRVWHVVITPQENGAFNEFDIIKLIHLYDGRAEHTKLKEEVRFRVDQYSEEIEASRLLLSVCAEVSQVAKLTAGTVEIIPGPQASESDGFDKLLHIVQNARKPDGGECHGRLEQWMGAKAREWQVLKAYCGIVTGIFDFDNMDVDELLDTLEPTVSESSGFLLINRCTLTHIPKKVRLTDELWSTVGISPYLIIPHAVLLHNEALVDEAAEKVDKVLPTGPETGKKGIFALLLEEWSQKSYLSKLGEAHKEADRNLNRLYLPNVFNYPTERSLYEKGGHQRGSADKQSATLTKLGELHNLIEVEKNKQRKRGQRTIAMVLLLLVLVEFVKTLDDLCPGILSPGVIVFIGGVYVVLVGLMFYFDLGGVEESNAKRP